MTNTKGRSIIIFMKLRNKLNKFKLKHNLYCLGDLWEKYDIVISMLAFWTIVLTLIGMEANGLI